MHITYLSKIKGAVARLPECVTICNDNLPIWKVVLSLQLGSSFQVEPQLSYV